MRLSQTILYPFETEFGPYETKLTRLSKEIREEISLASKQARKEEDQLQARERQEARISRHMLTIFGDRVSRNDEEAKKWRLERDRRKLGKNRFRALEALSTYDYQRTFKQIRKECVPGTSTWIFDNSDFRAWMEGPVKTLWRTGRSK